MNSPAFVRTRDDMDAPLSMVSIMKNRWRQEPNATPRSKNPAVFGALRGMMSRSRSLSRSRPLWKEELSSFFPEEDYCFSEQRTSAAVVGVVDSATNSVTSVRADRNKEPLPRGGYESRRTEREENFHAALDIKLVHMALAAFCDKTLSSENIDFVLQVRELNQLLAVQGTTAGDLRERLRKVTATFVTTDSPAEVNVEGSTREKALSAIQAALDAAGSDGGSNWWWKGREGSESPSAWKLAEVAIDALTRLAREVHSVIFDGLWPRFLASEEFAAMMDTEEMRTVGFVNLDGKLIVGALPPKHPGRWGAGGGLPANKNQLSIKLASHFRSNSSDGGGLGGSRGGGITQTATTAASWGVCGSVIPSASRRMSRSSSTPRIGRGGSTTGDALGVSKASWGVRGSVIPSASRRMSRPSSTPRSGRGGSTIGDALGVSKAVRATSTALPPLGRRCFGRPSLGACAT